MTNRIRLSIPADADAVKALKLGDVVYLDGVVYTAREGAYKRVVEEKVPLPEGLTELSNVNFHCSPAASVHADGSYKVGAVTATASFRFAKWIAEWMALSEARIIIGKGGMSKDIYRDVFVPAGAVYLNTVGYGTGALLGRGVKGVVDAHWLHELGIAQAIWVLRVENFGPFIVEGDTQGNSLIEQANREINRGLKRVYAGLKPPTLGRFGETTSRDDELI